MKALPTAGDLMEILSIIYDVEAPRRQWLRRVLLAMAPSLNRGAGIGGVLYDLSSASGFHVDALDGVDVPEDFVAAGRQIHSHPGYQSDIINTYRTHVCTTFATEMAEPQMADIRRTYQDHDLKSQVMINGLDCSGKGFCVYLFTRSEPTLTTPQRSLYARLATHLASGYRLQRRMAAAEPVRAASLEAVLEPDGAVVHAEVPAKSTQARQDLQHAVRLREELRDRRTAETEHVIRDWRGLVSARWTLVDRYERDGKRYVLARENGPEPVARLRFPTVKSRSLLLRVWATRTS